MWETSQRLAASIHVHTFVNDVCVCFFGNSGKEKIHFFVIVVNPLNSLMEKTALLQNRQIFSDILKESDSYGRGSFIHSM